MLLFLLSDTVHFMPLRSTYRAKCLTLGQADPGPTAYIPLDQLPKDALNQRVFTIPIRACSPKSMYSLADAYRLDELQDRSLESILSSLTPQNILLEVFSDFSGKHDEVLERELDYLEEHWAEVKKSAAWKTIHNNVHIARGSPNHQKAWERILSLL